MERLNDYHMARRVLLISLLLKKVSSARLGESDIHPISPEVSGVSGERVRGRPRLIWMDGVKVAFATLTVEAARQRARDRKTWRALVHKYVIAFHSAIFAWPGVLPDCPHVLWWLSPGEGWNPVT